MQVMLVELNANAAQAEMTLVMLIISFLSM